MTEKHHKKQKNMSDEIKVKIEETKPGTAGEDGREKDVPAPLEKMQSQLEEKTREAAENFDKWVRSVAELENFKKRAQKEKADLLKFSNESILKALLPVLDNLERAVHHGKETGDDSPLLEGVEITLKQFLGALEKFGVRPISAAGEEFDPEKHEAVLQQEADGAPNRVISELEKGYFYNDRLLRPAKVIVSKEKPGQET